MGTPGLPAAPAPTPRLVLAGLLSRHTWPLLRAPPPLAATPAPRRPRSWKFPRRAVSHDPFFSSCVGCAASYRGSREAGRHRRRRQCGIAGRGPGPRLGAGWSGEQPRPALLVPAPPPDPKLSELRGFPGALRGRSSLGGGESAPTE